MKHEEIKRLIQKDLDRETSDQEKKVLKSHLVSCDHCQQYYHEMVFANQAINCLTEYSPRHDFNARVLRKIGIAQERSAWIKLLPVVSGAWLASALCILFSPVFGSLLGKAITSIPAAKRFFDWAMPVVESLNHFLMPFAKNFLTSPIPYLGLVFCILLTFALSQLIKKEETCKA